MADIPEWLQPLLNAGVLTDTASSTEKNENLAAELHLPQTAQWANAADNPSEDILCDAKMADNSDIPSSIIAPPNSFDPPTKSQKRAKRSALLKAYAHSIRGLMTPESDLRASGQALFIASPLQKGIPIGVKEEFINEAIFQHGNSIQSPLSPIYRPGVGDYFGWLNKYLNNVKDIFSSDADADKKTLLEYARAKENAEKEYEDAVNQFARVKGLDPTVKFQQWMNQYATDYADACKERDALGNKLRPSSVKLAKEMFDDAQARLQPKQGNNMLCAFTDVDMGMGGDNAKPTDIVYRPRYYLSGYQSTAKRWRDEYCQKFTSPEQRIISFEGLKDLKWSQLGITDSDSDDDFEATAETADFEVTLTYTGICSFDVRRGLWNIDDFRTLLPQLASTAPPDCKQPVYKTTKLLLAYGVDLVLKLPKTMDQDLAKRLRLMPGVLDDLPLTLVGGNELHAKPQTNDAYPVLLAVLADVC
ncbi:hypothetical protein O1611_g2061 [Lasiodiplodia mahajangana]|uniref:Uncharacterized protein n=1 Tax=Lasiodiplodia mahajangana TaxID=1108764 RepID=A0ACC2JVY4_9PEZI|nr:hypothetical protein O1611_g2061 [Lasiodiplodia mahajangana]